LDRLNQLNRFSELQLRQVQTENLNYQQSLKLAEAETAKQQSEIQLFILNEEVHNQARLQAKRLNRIIFIGFAVIIIALALTGHLTLLAVKNKKELNEKKRKKEGKSAKPAMRKVTIRNRKIILYKTVFFIRRMVKIFFKIGDFVYKNKILNVLFSDTSVKNSGHRPLLPVF
jgi:hypothetical protein